MAKFCVHCGRPLQEGEVCSCRNQSAPPTPEVRPEPQAAQPAAAAGTASICWQLVKDSFRAPASVLPAFAASGDRNTALLLLGARAVSFALFMTVLCNQIKTSIHSMMGSLSSFASGSGADQYLDFPLGKIFILSLLLSAAAALLFAGLLLVFSKYVYKADTTYDRMLCVSAAGGVAGIPFLLAGLLILFLSIKFGLYLAAFGILLQLLFVSCAFRKAGALDGSRSIYALFLSLAVQVIILAVFVKVFSPMYLPDALQEAIKQMQSSMANGGGLANLFR